MGTIKSKSLFAQLGDSGKAVPVQKQFGEMAALFRQNGWHHAFFNGFMGP
jgi:hypothetical protein